MIHISTFINLVSMLFGLARKLSGRVWTSEASGERINVMLELLSYLTCIVSLLLQVEVLQHEPYMVIRYFLNIIVCALQFLRALTLCALIIAHFHTANQHESIVSKSTIAKVYGSCRFIGKVISMLLYDELMVGGMSRVIRNIGQDVVLFRVSGYELKSKVLLQGIRRVIIAVYNWSHNTLPNKIQELMKKTCSSCQVSYCMFYSLCLILVDVGLLLIDLYIFTKFNVSSFYTIIALFHVLLGSFGVVADFMSLASGYLLYRMNFKLGQAPSRTENV